MVTLEIYAPNYFFTPIEGDLLSEYNKGFCLGEIFKVKGQSITTSCDELLINTNLDKLKANINEYLHGKSQIKIGETTKSKPKDQNGTYKSLPYRAFDNRFFYDSKLVHCSRNNLVKHEQIESNMYLNFQVSTPDIEKYSHILITKYVPERKLVKGKSVGHTAPLYILNDEYQIEDIDDSLYNFKIGACPVIKNWLKARQDEEIILEELLLIINKCKETIRIRSELDKCWN